MASKTINYRRAVWLASTQSTLADHINDARQRLPTVADRKVAKANGQVLKCLRFNAAGSQGVLMHVVAETPGDHASIINTRQEKGWADH